MSNPSDHNNTKQYSTPELIRKEQARIEREAERVHQRHNQGITRADRTDATRGGSGK